MVWSGGFPKGLQLDFAIKSFAESFLQWFPWGTSYKLQQAVAIAIVAIRVAASLCTQALCTVKVMNLPLQPILGRKAYG